MGQNRIKGGWGVQKPHKMWDIIYARSLSINPSLSFYDSALTLIGMRYESKKNALL